MARILCAAIISHDPPVSSSPPPLGPSLSLSPLYRAISLAFCTTDAGPTCAHCPHPIGSKQSRGTSTDRLYCVQPSRSGNSGIFAVGDVFGVSTYGNPISFRRQPSLTFKPCLRLALPADSDPKGAKNNPPATAIASETSTSLTSQREKMELITCIAQPPSFHHLVNPSGVAFSLALTDHIILETLAPGSTVPRFRHRADTHSLSLRHSPLGQPPSHAHLTIPAIEIYLTLSLPVAHPRF